MNQKTNNKQTALGCGIIIAFLAVMFIAVKSCVGNDTIYTEQYQSGDKFVVEERMQKDNTIQERRIYSTVNGKNVISAVEVFSTNGLMLLKKEYDSHGKISVVKYFNDDGVSVEHLYKYDENGEIRFEKHYSK